MDRKRKRSRKLTSGTVFVRLISLHHFFHFSCGGLTTKRLPILFEIGFIYCHTIILREARHPFNPIFDTSKRVFQPIDPAE